MAKVAESEYVAGNMWRVWGRTVLIGAVVGLVFWVLTMALTRYVIEPLTCRQLVDAASCGGSFIMAGNIATIIAGVISLVVMVRMRIAQPIIVAVGAAVLTWGLAGWTEGLFWFEGLVWAVVLYAFAYALMAWITRYPQLIGATIIALVVSLIIRIALILS